jgi:RNase P/RNase MRP subunit p29
MKYLNKSRFGLRISCCLVLAGLLVAAPARSQNARASQQDESALTGAVVSATRNTLVVRGENGQYHLFVFDRDTEKPRTLTVGSTVRVVSIPGEEAGVRVARAITALEAAPAAQRAGTQQPAQPVPPEIRRIERDIERQLRRFQAGVRAGIALDPELILLGVHAQVGPFFNPDIYLRPNVEFAFGEVTALFALNLEAIYRLPVSSRQGRWSAYVGAGPGFSFLHQNFERETGEGRDIDFGDFSSDVGFNILGGLRYRNGMFLELKSSIYSRPAPALRLIVGYNF